MSLLLILRTLRELGPLQVGLFALYQLGKKTGYWHWWTRGTGSGEWRVGSGKGQEARGKGQGARRKGREASGRGQGARGEGQEASGRGQGARGEGQVASEKYIPLPGGERVAALIDPAHSKLIAAADETIRGHVTLFGRVTVPLQLTVPGPLRHWTHHETPLIDGRDVKWVWEPARFGWVYTLGRAYHITGNEAYPAAFWRYLETFLAANPPNMGPHWVSAQEVGLRLLGFVFASRVFAASTHTTPERKGCLAQAIAAHAARIPPTLLYARAQNNNHLLTEATALYTAGLVLPDHPQARRWRALGWRWLHHALQTQIEPDGAYVQQSTNYHRLMLQAALWAKMLADQAGDPFPEKSLDRLAAATHWLLALLDPQTGRVPNLGPNDGAYILPLTVCPFHDYRPALQAASIAFLGKRIFEAGEWDEMALWLCKPASPQIRNTQYAIRNTYCVLRTYLQTWGYLRATHFTHRPGHADQLHLDLWWRGHNIALDPGTYLYNAPPPWDNALTAAYMHNTVTVNRRDQMTRAGRFLYIDRAQAKVIERSETRLVAEHNGYRSLGITHRRMVETTTTGWLITDTLHATRNKSAGGQGGKLVVSAAKPSANTQHDRVRSYAIRNTQYATRNTQHVIRLHWLLPDWPWKLDGSTLHVKSPHGCLALSISHIPYSVPHTQPPIPQSPVTNPQSPIPNHQSPITNIHLTRAGERLHGSGPTFPTWGWHSPTYGVKEPALSFAVEVESDLPVTLVSEWRFPQQ